MAIMTPNTPNSPSNPKAHHHMAHFMNWLLNDADLDQINAWWETKPEDFTFGTGEIAGQSKMEISDKVDSIVAAVTNANAGKPYDEDFQFAVDTEAISVQAICLDYHSLDQPAECRMILVYGLKGLTLLVDTNSISMDQLTGFDSDGLDIIQTMATKYAMEWEAANGDWQSLMTSDEEPSAPWETDGDDWKH